MSTSIARKCWRQSRLVAQTANQLGTARLEEAVAAFRDALKEYTRKRAPFDWATCTGNEGIALRYLAEGRGDFVMALRALEQITAASQTFREAAVAPLAANYEAQRPAAQVLVERLRKRDKAPRPLGRSDSRLGQRSKH